MWACVNRLQLIHCWGEMLRDEILNQYKKRDIKIDAFDGSGYVNTIYLQTNKLILFTSYHPNYRGYYDNKELIKYAKIAIQLIS